MAVVPLCSFSFIISGGTVLFQAGVKVILNWLVKELNVHWRMLSAKLMVKLIFWKKGTEYLGVEPIGGERTR